MPNDPQLWFISDHLLLSVLYIIDEINHINYLSMPKAETQLIDLRVTYDNLYFFVTGEFSACFIVYLVI